jgi:hypothetical protein
VPRFGRPSSLYLQATTIWEARNGERNNERIIHPRRIVERIKAIYLHCSQETQQKMQNNVRTIASLLQRNKR